MSLWAEFLTNKGRPIAKWAHYFPAYEAHFGRYVNRPMKFLEIGCWLGGSLQMWKRYFGPHAMIVGIDINPDCAAFEEDQIAIRIGDQADPDFLKAVVDEFGTFDAVLDDGSHMMEHIAASFGFLYPRIAQDGIYMVEDLHTAYMENYGGGLRRTGTFIELCKDMIDELNGTWRGTDAPPTEFTHSTQSMHFYDSIVAFERGRTLPRHALVMPPPEHEHEHGTHTRQTESAGREFGLPGSPGVVGNRDLIGADRSMSAAQLLVPITSVAGTSDIRETTPKVLDFTDVLYLPYRKSGPWGIYDAQGAAIEGAVNFLGTHREPVHQLVTVTPEPAEAMCNEPDLVYVGEIMTHFGHFLTQTLSRFWYLRERPQARVLFHSTWNTAQLFSFQHVAQIFEALGLREEQFVRLEVPTLVQGLTVPQPGWEEMHFAHQIYGECLREIGAFFTQGDVLADEGPLYLSKARLDFGVHRFVDEQEIEDEFARQGVRVVHPETLSLPQQIDTLRRHRTLLGCCGSAFHSTVMLPEGHRIVGLNHIETLSANFELIDKLSGNRASYYYAPSTKKVDDPKFMRAFRIDDPVSVARELLQRI